MNQHKSGQRIGERAIGIISRLLIVTGAVLIGFYAVASVHRVVTSRMALRQFTEAEQKKLVPNKSPASVQGTKHSIDFGLWSAERIAAFKKAIAKQFAPAQAVLQIPRIGLKVPVFEGTDRLTLNRGVGLIAGTARPGQEGNLGIAGHRDGFFRGLKDVLVGDRIQLKTTGGKESYRVDTIRIVKPNDVQVLEDRGVPTLTLVTCYPFYYVGNAPLRYIIQASLLHEDLHGKISTQPN